MRAQAPGPGRNASEGASRLPKTRCASPVFQESVTTQMEAAVKSTSKVVEKPQTHIYT